MLKRKIYDDLVAWKERESRLPLVVKGARQVGKTYIIDLFAKNNYEKYIKINFVEMPSAISIFDGELDSVSILKQISLKVRNADVVPGNTLLFLDEIQECPKARAALKFLAEDDRIDVIASGSLLGINYKHIPSFPVGYTQQLEMHSLDFEEFLWACGVSADSIADLRNCYESREKVSPVIHDKMMELFREYIVVGGMPNVVSNYVEHNDFAEVLRIQRGILDDYEADIAKYAEGNEKAKARACFLSIPRHLAKDYKKFQYSLVEPRGTSTRFAGSLMWLYDAGIINFCYNLELPELPFEGNVNEGCFKVYMRDTGLLVAMLEDGSQEDIIDGNLGIYKGAVYENIIADIFTKSGRKLYYFEHKSQLEMDFMIRYKRELTAIEVKSADNTKAKSMSSMIENWHVKHGIKLSSKNVGGTEKVDSFPLYMAMFL